VSKLTVNVKLCGSVEGSAQQTLKSLVTTQHYIASLQSVLVTKVKRVGRSHSLVHLSVCALPEYFLKHLWKKLKDTTNE
jgi:hypothetical protein